MKPCGLCKFKGRGVADLNHHIETVHKLTPEQYKMAADTVRQALAPVQLINSAMRKAGMIVAALAVIALSGCHQYRRAIGAEPYEEDIPNCSHVTALNVALPDPEIMAALTFDQKNRLDNQAQFFDGRAPAIETVRNLYNHTQQFPTPDGFVCLDEAEFRRVVEASSNLGRFPLH